VAGSPNTTTITVEQFNPTTGAVLAERSQTYVNTVTHVAGTPSSPPMSIASVSGSGGPPLNPDTSANAGTVNSPDVSASGGLTLTVSVTSPSNYTYNSVIQWCWGGGVPGVHWGYVYNCGSSPGSSVAPYMSAYFTNLPSVGQKVVSNLSGSNRYYFGWSSMNYSYNTGYYDYSQGDTCTTILYTGVCVAHEYPDITINVYANGYYTYSGQANNIY
jgi:hypothetical protein